MDTAWAERNAAVRALELVLHARTIDHAKGIARELLGVPEAPVKDIDCPLCGGKSAYVIQDVYANYVDSPTTAPGINYTMLKCTTCLGAVLVRRTEVSAL